MPIKIGHASIDENKKASGGKAGDQTGSEVCIRSWYSSPWDLVLRPKDSTKAEKMAQACEDACGNKNIGYDQYQRNTLNEKAKAVGYKLSKITTACECDCSSLMTVCAQAAGIDIPYVYGNAPYTGNMRDQFMKTGEFEALTASKFLTSDAHLKRGDILVRTNGHTAMVLGNGAQAGGVSTVAITVRVLKKGHKGDDVKALQILLNGLGYECGEADGDFGSKTAKALKAFQKKEGLEQDGVCGQKSWSKLLN